MIGQCIEQTGQGNLGKTEADCESTEVTPGACPLSTVTKESKKY